VSDFFNLEWRIKSMVVIFAIAAGAFVVGGVMRLFGLPAASATAAAMFTAGLAALVMPLFRGEDLDSLVPVAGLVFMGLSIFVLVWNARHGLSWVPGLLVMIGVVVIGPTGAILGRRFVRGTRARARDRECDQHRRELADKQGWSFQKSDPDLVQRLGSLETKVSPMPGVFAVLGPTIVLGGQAYSPSHGRLSAVAPARAVLAGQVDGVRFWVFDFQNRRRAYLRTAWLAELPHDLPYLGMPIALCSDHWTRAKPTDTAFMSLAESNSSAFFDQPYSYTEAPDFARTVMTPDVRRFTAQRLPAWWIDGRYLATTTGPDSAPVDLVMRNVRLITELARLLPKDVLARWAQSPQPPGTGSRSWVARSQSARQPGRQKAS
jgi:hypothetical protein